MSDKQDPGEYFFKKSLKNTYVSKSMMSEDNRPGSLPSPKRFRLVSRVMEDEHHEFAVQHGELVIDVSSGQRVEFLARYYEDTRGIGTLTIQRFEKRTGMPHKKTSLSLSQKGLQELLGFLRSLDAIPLDDPGTMKFNNSYLDNLLRQDEEKLAFLKANHDLVTQFVQNEITEQDIVALGYRKKQLAIFRRLLTENGFINECRQAWGVQQKGNEAVWQRYFEDNTWIFGYGLSYIFNTPLDERKLEQITSGAAFDQVGKRIDGLLKTKGVVSSLCFIEIKTPDTALLANSAYRTDCWSVSAELAGSVAQVQKTVQRAVKDIRTKTEMIDKEANLTGEVVFLYQPKSYVIIGNLAEFSSAPGINESKFGSFELFRKNLVNPEVITFDELYQRALFIVQNAEIDDVRSEVEEVVDEVDRFDYSIDDESRESSGDFSDIPF